MTRVPVAARELAWNLRLALKWPQIIFENAQRKNILQFGIVLHAAFSVTRYNLEFLEWPKYLKHC